MVSKVNILKYLLIFIALGFLWFRVLLPKLVSANSDAAILVGVVATMVVAYFAGQFIKEKTDNEE